MYNKSAHRRIIGDRTYVVWQQTPTCFEIHWNPTDQSGGAWVWIKPPEGYSEGVRRTWRKLSTACRYLDEIADTELLEPT